MAQVTKQNAIDRISNEIKDKVIPAINKNTNAIANDVVKVNQPVTSNGKLLGVVSGKVTAVDAPTGATPISPDVLWRINKNTSNGKPITEKHVFQTEDVPTDEGVFFAYNEAYAKPGTYTIIGQSFIGNGGFIRGIVDVDNIVDNKDYDKDTYVLPQSSIKRLFVSKQQPSTSNGKILGIENGRVVAVDKPTSGGDIDTSQFAYNDLTNLTSDANARILSTSVFGKKIDFADPGNLTNYLFSKDSLNFTAYKNGKEQPAAKFYFSYGATPYVTPSGVNGDFNNIPTQDLYNLVTTNSSLANRAFVEGYVNDYTATQLRNYVPYNNTEFAKTDLGNLTADASERLLYYYPSTSPTGRASKAFEVINGNVRSALTLSTNELIINIGLVDGGLDGGQSLNFYLDKNQTPKVRKALVRAPFNPTYTESLAALVVDGDNLANKAYVDLKSVPIDRPTTENGKILGIVSGKVVAVDKPVGQGTTDGPLVGGTLTAQNMEDIYKAFVTDRKVVLVSTYDGFGSIVFMRQDKTFFTYTDGTKTQTLSVGEAVASKRVFHIRWRA